MNDCLLAKSTGETLFQHTVEVARAIRQVAANLPDGILDQVEVDELVLCAVFHDVGKAATGFQQVLDGKRRDWGGKRHEVLSAALAARCKDLSDESLLAILTHHRTLPVDGNAGNEKAAIPEDQMPDADTATWGQMTREFDSNREKFSMFWAEACDAIGRPDLGWLAHEALQTLRLDPAWLKQSPSSRYGQLSKIAFERRRRAALYRGLLVTADHMASAKTPPRPLRDLRQTAVYKGELRGFQEKCSGLRGNAIVRAPTGSGKTESSLFWMQANWRKNNRVFYVLPYTASINAMHKRLATIFGNDSVNVLHGKASAYLYSLLKEDSASCDAQAQAQSLAQLAREMYFPIRVSTPHQLLRYALRGRGWEQMLGEFPQACFIFDEIHAYDPHMTGLILGMANMATKWDARLLFATATMPHFLKQLIQQTIGIPDDHVITPNPLDERDRKVLDRKRHRIDVWDGNLVSRFADIAGTVDSCPSTLIVCNHVRTAQRVFGLCQGRFGESAVLLHSRFAPRDRNAIEKRLLEKPLPRVFVATQVIEVSLNLDFGQGFLEPAPIDAEAQRMGRVNRYGTRPPARIAVMRDQTHSHHIYDRAITSRTLELLQNVENPISEDALVALSDEVYAGGYQDSQLRDFTSAFHHPSFEELEQRLIAGTHHDWADDLFDSEDKQIQVLPEHYLEDYKQAMKDGDWLEARSMLISLPAHVKSNPKYWRAFEEYEDHLWIIYKPYDPINGLRLEAAEKGPD